MFKFLIYDTQDRTAIITINRPDKRNALNGALVEELIQTFKIANIDSGIKVIQLRANGVVFSAGADLDYLQQLQSNTYEQNLADSQRLAELFKTIVTLPKPVIACVQGAAIAGGCGLATVCDFSVVVDDAQLGYTESRIGFVPAVVMIFLLRKIGDTAARDLMLTGKLITAEKAKQIGLVTKVVTKNDFEPTIEKLTQTLLNDASSQSMALIKKMMLDVPVMTLDNALQYAAETNAKARGSDDCKRGIAAFLNKEKIKW